MKRLTALFLVVFSLAALPADGGAAEDAPAQPKAGSGEILAGLGAASLGAESQVIVLPRRWTGHVSYIFGYKRLADGWSPAVDQAEFGLIDFDCRKEDWPLSFAGQFLVTYAGQVPQGLSGNNSGTYELNLGARKVWDKGGIFQPFAGGGVSLIGASNSSFIDFGGGESAQVNEHSAATVGFWGDAGLYWLWGERWHSGVQLEYSWGRVRLGGKALNAGGVHILGMIGIHWR